MLLVLPVAAGVAAIVAGEALFVAGITRLRLVELGLCLCSSRGVLGVVASAAIAIMAVVASFVEKLPL